MYKVRRVPIPIVMLISSGNVQCRIRCLPDLADSASEAMTKKPGGGQFTFRVALGPRTRPTAQSQGALVAVEDAQYHARRPHKKSRGGCEGCKQRRRKASLD
jgi:hypothetical protein